MTRRIPSLRGSAEIRDYGNRISVVYFDFAVTSDK